MDLACASAAGAGRHATLRARAPHDTHTATPHPLPQDVARLRQIAAVRGLVSTELRARLWPVLLGGQPVADSLALPGPAAPQQGQLSRRASSEAACAGRSSLLAAATTNDDSSSSEYQQWAAGMHKDNSTVRAGVCSGCAARSPGPLVAAAVPMYRRLLSLRSPACNPTTHPPTHTARRCTWMWSARCTRLPPF